MGGIIKSYPQKFFNIYVYSIAKSFYSQFWFVVRVWLEYCFFLWVYSHICFSICNIARKGIFIKHINNVCTNPIIMWHFYGCCLVQSTDGGTLKPYWTDVTWLRQDCVLRSDKTENKILLLYRTSFGGCIRNLEIIICINDIFSSKYQALPAVEKLRYTWPIL